MLEWRESAERIAGFTSDSASAGISPNHSGKLSTILLATAGSGRLPPNLSHHSASPNGAERPHRPNLGHHSTSLSGGERLQSDAAPNSPRMGEAHSTASMFAKLKLLGMKGEVSGEAPCVVAVWGQYVHVCATDN